MHSTPNEPGPGLHPPRDTPGGEAQGPVHGAEAAVSLRLAVISSSLLWEDWQARCLQSLLRQPRVELVLVVLGSRSAGELWLMGPVGRERASRLWTWYDRAFVRRRSRAKQLVDPAKFLPATTIVLSVPRSTPPDEVHDQLQRAGLDVILQLDGGMPAREVAAAARLGVWRFSVEVEQAERGTPPCFWEVYSAQPVTATALERVTLEPAGREVLTHAVTKTLLHSYVRTLDTMYYATASLPVRACKEILAGNARLGCSGEALPSLHPPATRRSPATTQAMMFMLTSVQRYLSSLGHFLLFEDQWRVGVVSAPIHDFLRGPVKAPLRWVPNDSDGFLADPFGVMRDGRLTILAERYDRSAGKGEVAVVEGEGGTDHSDSRVIFSSDSNIAYPFLLTIDANVYCLPEMSPRREAALYRGNPFPFTWEKVASLLTAFVAVDSTVFRHGRYWWLFCTGRPAGDELGARTYKGGVDSTLFVWYAENLFGPWLPHALNPVKVDVRSSRPGGTPFDSGGELYRPAQDCSRTYGGSVVINRIVSLTPSAFAEEPVAVVAPFEGDGFGAGLHTLSAVGDETLIDAKRVVFAPRGIPRKIRYMAIRLAPLVRLAPRRRVTG